jgi:hypothetical protein
MMVLYGMSLESLMKPWQLRTAPCLRDRRTRLGETPVRGAVLGTVENHDLIEPGNHERIPIRPLSPEVESLDRD